MFSDVTTELIVIQERLVDVENEIERVTVALEVITKVLQDIVEKMPCNHSGETGPF